MHTCWQRGRIPLLLALLLAAGASCADTKLVATWKDAKYAGGQFRKIFVIARFRNLKNRIAFENETVRQLATRGVEAIPSLAVLSPERDYKQEELLAKFQELGIDGLLLMKLADVEQKHSVRSESFGFGTSPFIYPGLGFFSFYYGFTPGYVEEITNIYIIDGRLFAAPGDRMVWIAEVRNVEYDAVSVEMGNSVKTAKKFARLIVQRLRKDRMIP